MKDPSLANTSGSAGGGPASGTRPPAASSKKRSIPPGEKTSSTLAGSVPGLEVRCATPPGTTTKEPAGAKILRGPARTVSSPSRT